MKIGKSGGGHHHRRHHALPVAEINIIPLVDITLVLLIIFMATTAFVKEAGINMSLPKAKNSSATPAEDKDLNIAIARDGKLYLNARASNEDEIQRVMAATARKNSQTRVIIKGDENIAYKRIVDVMDMARGAGLPKVALGTRFPDEARTVEPR